MKNNAMQFFRLPLEKKNAVGIRAGGLRGFGHHFSGPSRDKLDWAESLILTTQENEQANMELWPADPPTFRDALEKYSLQMSGLARRLVGFMASDL